MSAGQSWCLGQEVWGRQVTEAGQASAGGPAWLPGAGVWGGQHAAARGPRAGSRPTGVLSGEAEAPCAQHDRGSAENRLRDCPTRRPGCPTRLHTHTRLPSPRGPPAQSAALRQDSTEPPRRHSSSPEPPVRPAWRPQVPSVRQFQDDAGWLTTSWQPQVYPGPGECQTVLTELPSQADTQLGTFLPRTRVPRRCPRVRQGSWMLRPLLPTQPGGEGLAPSWAQRTDLQNSRGACPLPARGLRPPT